MGIISTLKFIEKCKKDLKDYENNLLRIRRIRRSLRKVFGLNHLNYKEIDDRLEMAENFTLDGIKNFRRKQNDKKAKLHKKT